MVAAIGVVMAAVEMVAPSGIDGIGSMVTAAIIGTLVLATEIGTVVVAIELGTFVAAVDVGALWAVVAIGTLVLATEIGAIVAAVDVSVLWATVEIGTLVVATETGTLVAVFDVETLWAAAEIGTLVVDIGVLVAAVELAVDCKFFIQLSYIGRNVVIVASFSNGIPALSSAFATSARDSKFDIETNVAATMKIQSKSDTAAMKIQTINYSSIKRQCASGELGRSTTNTIQ